MLGSAGVIAAALIIRFTGWSWVDPLVAVGIGLWVLPRTWTLLKASTHILLEGTPAEVDMAKLRAHIEQQKGVKEIHDIHVWTLTSGRHVLTAHVVIDGTQAPDLLKSLSSTLRDDFKIFHTTIQLEEVACDDLHGPLHGPADGHKDEDGHAGHSH